MDCTISSGSQQLSSALELSIPGDKSISHRALMMAALSDSSIELSNLLMGLDCVHTSTILSQLGVDIDVQETSPIQVRGVGLRGLQASPDVLDVGNSGTSIRLLTGLLSGQLFDSTLTGDSSIQQRPMLRVIDPLTSMGAMITGQSTSDSNDISPPLHIKGGASLHGISYTLPMPSAQVKSSILFASLFAEGSTTIIEPIPCRDHTERLFNVFGVDLTQDNTRITCTPPAKLSYEGGPLVIPGDFSSAAFFLVYGLLAAPHGLTLKGVGLNPTRARLLDILQKMGGRIDIDNISGAEFEPIGDVTVYQSSLVQPIISHDDIPFIIDEIPILTVASLFASGEFTLTGASELKVKESDRIHSLVTMVNAMGGEIEEFEDGFRFTGPLTFKPFQIASFGDHRIAMSGIIAGLVSDVEASILDCDCIDTSFPGFFSSLEGLDLKHTIV